ESIVVQSSVFDGLKSFTIWTFLPTGPVLKRYNNKPALTSVAFAVQFITVPTAAGDITDDSNAVVIAAMDGEAKAAKRNSNVSQQFRADLEISIYPPFVSTLG